MDLPYTTQTPNSYSKVRPAAVNIAAPNGWFPPVKAFIGKKKKKKEKRKKKKEKWNETEINKRTNTAHNAHAHTNNWTQLKQ